MTKKILIPAGIFLLFAFYSLIASAQCYRVHYCSGCVKNGLCEATHDFKTDNEAYASLYDACSKNSDGWVEKVSSCGGPGPIRKLRFTPIGTGIELGAVGALITSFQTDVNGRNQWDAGFAGGFGFGIFLGQILEPKSRPFGKLLVMDILAGGSLGYSLGKELPLLQPDNPKVEDKTVVTSLVGAGGGVLIAVLDEFTGFHKKTRGGASSFRFRRSNLIDKMSFALTGNGMKIIVHL